jgi:diacylglycerol kinase family enzyme
MFERIRELAREYSIAGEISQASPARSATDLVRIAIEKNYTTIIAIGNDTHINKVASAILNFRPQFPVALGIVCTDPESILAEKWFFKTPEEACETLKYRKLEKFTVGFIEPNHHFLSSARIECRRPTRIVLEVDHWRAEAIVDRVEISNNLYILLERFYKESSGVKSAFNWLLGKEAINADQSVFKGKVIRITSQSPLSVYIGDEPVTETPVNILRKINVLNIITKRAKVVSDLPS